MPANGSVSAWIQQLKDGNEAVLSSLHARYWPALVDLARRRLERAPCRAADDEDVAQEAFWSFFRSLKAGRLPRLANRQDLLALLTHIVAARAANQIEYERARKRGEHLLLGESVLDQRNGTGPEGRALEQAPGTEPTPLEQAVLKDCYQHYLNALPAPLRVFAEYFLAGYTHPEIAQRVGCVTRTVDRKVALILARWQELADLPEKP